MLAWLTALTVAQTVAPSQTPLTTGLQVGSDQAPTLIAQAPSPEEFVVEQSVRPLPGDLNDVPVFNSNSPELVEESGILLSTFPPTGMAVPEAHLDFPFSGRFDIFAHHVYKALDYDEENPELLDSLYIGILVNNPGTEPVNVRVMSGASYLSQPDAPFVELPDFVPFSPLKPVYAGPGSRVAGDMLQGRLQDIFPPTLAIPPGESRMLLNQPIPIRELDQPINGRSTLAYLESDGPVYVASMAQFATVEESADGGVVESAPTQAAWETLLQESGLAGPRDLEPAPLPLAEGDRLIYGRVAGVSQGSEWKATLTDTLTTKQLTIPSAGEAFSYGISLLYAGTMGTSQNQSAEMLVRYPDTAYQSHGNYGVRYSLTLPLQNSTDRAQTVTVALETPIKEDTLSEDGLRFLEPLPTQTFFRGPIQVRYQNDRGLPVIRNIHIVMKRGQSGIPLATLTLPPLTSRTVDVALIYPADSTPPQVLTVKTTP